MKQPLCAIMCGVFAICSINATASSLENQANKNSFSNIQTQQQLFSVTGYYYQNGGTYKCKLKLKLVQSLYGQNSYIAVEYATDYYNNQWYWHSCNASCHYNASNRQYYVMIGYLTVYFDDPLE